MTVLNLFVELNATEGFLFIRNSYPPHLEAKALRVTANQRARREITKRNLVSLLSLYLHRYQSLHANQSRFSLNSGTLNDPNSESQQESQVFNVCPPLNKKYVWPWWRCSAGTLGSCFNSAPVFQVCTRGHGIWSWFHNTLRSGWR